MECRFSPATALWMNFHPLNTPVQPAAEALWQIYNSIDKYLLIFISRVTLPIPSPLETESGPPYDWFCYMRVRSW
jgi:hypothetical protein